MAAPFSNLLQNIGFYAAGDDVNATEEKWKKQTSKQVARERINGFHPSLHKLLDYCNEDDTYLWKVADRNPLPTYCKDRLIVLGDAAHPMLPTLGNGAGMAIEDAGALGVVMEGIKDLSEVTERLKVWDRVRRPRASATQLLSRTAGVEYNLSKETQDMVREYLSQEELPDFTRACVNRMLFSYDCLGEMRRAVKELALQLPLVDYPNDASTLTIEGESATQKAARKQTQTISSPPPYPGALKQAFLVVALMLAIFLVGLDMSIIATAIPTITKDFHSVDQVGWYGSAFFMCLAMFQGVWGKAYKYFAQKIVFLSCIFIFEVGSLVVALAPNSVAVVAGRAVQGLGGAGITSGCYLIATYVVKPSHLPTVMGLFGAIWACASVLGPVLGGVFTQDITWRWCFWINLPLGGVAFVVISFFFKTPPHSRLSRAPPWRKWPREFDVLGVILGLGAWICLLLVLQNGGTEHAWDSSFSIGLLVGFWLLVAAFIVAEWKQGDTAMIPKRILKNHTLPAGNSVVTAAHVLAAGATGLRQAFQNPKDLASVVASYMIGLKAAWIFSIAMSGAAFIAAFAGEWRSVTETATDARPLT
ncbi:MAG: hypothetical protein Q9227_009085 [Pyrenula ochraceoflavens]